MPRNSPSQSLAAIGERLELTRRVFGLHQLAFAERAKIPQNTYNQYERGKKRPSLDNALALREEYSLTLDWIYCGDPSGLKYDLAAAIKAIKSARAA
jgi:transcriptional regulator with XRE-family HTH domain